MDSTWHAIGVEEVIRKLKSNLKGLSEEEAKHILMIALVFRIIDFELFMDWMEAAGDYIWEEAKE